MAYRNIVVDGTRIAFREAGSPNDPAVLLLHGVPSSVRMYEGLLRKSGNKYRVVALDYPDFGNSDAPPPGDFVYTFEHLAQIVARFTDALNLSRYTPFIQDYGAPIGMRLAAARFGSVQAIIMQNANLYADAVGDQDDTLLFEPFRLLSAQQLLLERNDGTGMPETSPGLRGKVTTARVPCSAGCKYWISPSSRSVRAPARLVAGFGVSCQKPMPSSATSRRIMVGLKCDSRSDNRPFARPWKACARALLISSCPSSASARRL